ncbi:hypothetical protein NLI96_g6434 [Meripilus lineatus]|uniref:Uncharacterized protein n=1 Tax=Meripilus lineatus TaxID=2056292 RepID=A0AAD5V2Q0_9APHY|nr:hypothetical protein NLI96_g6434 [Physisporinus lineatus]
MGFGTIDDHGSDERVQSQSWELSPANLLEDDTWERGSEDVDRGDELIAENKTERARRIAMGVAEKPDDPEARSFSPFLVIDAKNFGSMGNFKVKSDIFLHAFRTKVSRAGEYMECVMKDRKPDRLTPEGGNRVKNLGPVTTFYVTFSRDTGKVGLKIGKNRPEDVKKFKSEQGYKFWSRGRNHSKKKEGDGSSRNLINTSISGSLDTSIPR